MRVVIFLLVFAACRPEGKGPGIDVERAMTHVKAIAAIGPRVHDSDGARAAVTYIEAELTKLGVAVERLPVGGVDLPGIEVLGQTRRKPHRATTDDPNLLVRFGPPGKALLIIAHYDTVPGSPGAVDNAAAVAVVLELARAFTEDKPAQSVLLAFTAAEEIGLVGAEALAAQRGHEVIFAVALDLIGGDGRLTLNGAGKLIGSAELQWMAEAAERSGIELSAPLAHRVISRWWPQAERSDHGAFTRRGLRAVHFYNRGNDGEWIDLAYHSPRDVPARVHPAALDETGRMLRAMVSLPMRDSDADGFWVPFVPNTVIVRWLLFAVCFILVLGTVAGLLAGKDGVLAARKREEPKERGAGLLVGMGCYLAGIAAAVGAERALASSHPAPWLHDPLRALGSSALIVGGVFGLTALIITQFVPAKGVLRYRLVAALVPLAIGSALLAIDAPELAWIWLVPAVMVALAPAPFAVLSTALPIVLVLHPDQLREAAWNGFLPIGIPLAASLAVFGVPLAASAAWVVRRYHHPARWIRYVLIAACVVALGAGIALASLTEPACSAEQFAARHLACELGD